MKKWRILSLILIIIIMALLLNTYSLAQKNETFQFKQERIDQQFSTTLSLLCTELFNQEPIDETAINELNSQLKLLLPLTTYTEIAKLEDITNILISVAEKPTKASAYFSPKLIEELEHFASNLGKPLPADIEEQSISIYSSLSVLSVQW